MQTEGPTPGRPFEKFRSSGKEEARPGGGIIKKRRRKSPANHINWISLVYCNIMRCVDFWSRSAHNSYTDTSTTQVTASFKLGRKMFSKSLGTNSVLRNG